MPIQLDNAQYKAFVSFAQGANDGNAIARAGGAAPADPLAGRTISAGTGDSVHALTRTTDSRKANDAARDIFRKAIAQIFGGEKQIPPASARRWSSPISARAALSPRAAFSP